MNWNLSDKHDRWNAISAVVLLFGLVSACAIYFLVPDVVDDTLGYKIVGDRMYPVVPSKLYVRNMELYGGKWTVLANDIGRWFNELWYGRSLGITIACISIVAAGLIFFFNNYVSFDAETDIEAGKDQGR